MVGAVRKASLQLVRKVLYQFAIKRVFFVGANLVFALEWRANIKFAPT